MKNYILICLVLFLGCHCIASDTLSFQLQNKATGLLLRPVNASKKDGAMIVLYPQQDWRCLTWDAVPQADGSFYFRNYFSEKSVQVKEKLVEQQVFDKNNNNFRWRLVKVKGGYYKIISASDESKVLTAPSGSEEQVKVLPWQNTDEQLWKLLPKPTHFTG